MLKEVSSLPSAQEITTGGGDYLHIKQGASDRKIRVFDLFKWHTDSEIAVGGTNPHGTTKTDIGLPQVANALQLIRDNDLSDLPNVTRARGHLDVNSKAEVAAAIKVHTDKRDNPHGVTKTQVGLSNVNNYPISHDINSTSHLHYASIGAVNEVYQKLVEYWDSLIGQVVQHLGTTPPAGWLEIHGQSARQLEVAGYPKLAAFVRANFGDEGSLPDTRGQFPRGWANGSVTDTNPNRPIGSLQNDTYPTHTHTCSSTGNHSHTRGNMNITGSFMIGWDRPVRVMNTRGGFSAARAMNINLHGGGDGWGNGECHFDASRTWTGVTSESGNHFHDIGNAGNGTETRPKNFAVMFIIKHD